MWVGIGIGLIAGNAMMLIAMMLASSLTARSDLESARSHDDPTDREGREPSGPVRL